MKKITLLLFCTLTSLIIYGQNVQTITYENWSNENWQNSSKYSYTYDNNNHLIKT